MAPLLEEPKHGAELRALGLRTSAWVVADVRASANHGFSYDVWVEAAHG